MDFSKVCRTCMSDQDLNQIFVDTNRYESYTRVIYLTAGVKVSPNDGLPQNMCTTCINQLNSCLKFRKKCIKVDTQLLNIKLNGQVNNDVCEKQNEKFNFNEIKLETISDEITSETDLELDLVKNELFMSKSPSRASSESDLDEKPLKYLLDLTDDESKPVVEHLEVIDSNKLGYTDQVSCKYCRKVLSVHSFKSHIARCHPRADDRKKKCDVCNTYILKRRMKRHKLKHQPASGKAFKCGYCKSEFDDKNLLVDHVKSCTVKKKRKLNEAGQEISECDICHKKMQKASLKRHKAVKHAGLGPVCEHCGRSFGNKLRLTEHYRAKHGYDKLKCSFCDFHTASVMSLKNHERRHRGEKPFVCESCGAKFHAAYLLLQHTQSHRTEKLIKCKMCPATFKTNNSLHMHRMTCHSTQLYKCTICSRAFSCRLYALKHIRLVHQLKGPGSALERVDNSD